MFSVRTLPIIYIEDEWVKLVIHEKRVYNQKWELEVDGSSFTLLEAVIK
jgi:hypothetical protein